MILEIRTPLPSNQSQSSLCARCPENNKASHIQGIPLAWDPACTDIVVASGWSLAPGRLCVRRAPQPVHSVNQVLQS